MHVLLSRLQFAFTIGFHFLMVPLTIGLILFIVLFELLHLKTGKEVYKRHSDFWGNLFAINFAVGIVTGVTMEIQFGTNWAEYSKFMGDIFGAPLAFEALMAFFLESTFGGIWIFYRHKISRKFRAITAILVMIGIHVSAVWIITANGFMQNPVGYAMAADGSKVVMTDFKALCLNPYALYMLLHTVTAAYLLGSFFVLAICGYHFLRKQHTAFFGAAVKPALIVLLISALSQPAVGHFYAQYIGKVQPAKAALFELTWETEESVPLYLVQIPHPEEERNTEFFGIPYLGSIMHSNDPHGTVVGIKEATADWTDEMVTSYKSTMALTYFSFRIMAGLGGLFVLLGLVGGYLAIKDSYTGNRWVNRAFLYLLPTPWIAITLGWIVAEVGRQPWIVHGLMLTKDAVSANVSAAHVAFSITTIFIFYILLLIIEAYILVKFIKKGPIEDPFRNRG